MPQRDADDLLQRYRAKRNFASTREPADAGTPSASALRFVVQKHWARQLHYDFRLELDGTLKSWAVPKGPSLDPKDRRMAVQVEDHPLTYADFEGEISEGNYGAGHVIVWDRGFWQPLDDPLEGHRNGKLRFMLHGTKLSGGWTLVRMHGRHDQRQPAWLLIKEKDAAARPAADHSVVEALPDSVLGTALPPARETQTVHPRIASKKTAKNDMRASPAARKKARPAVPASAPEAARPEVRTTSAAPALPAWLEVSHPDRVIDPSSGATKRDLIAHYARVADLMLPHLASRPVALLRAPRGVTGGRFFQKHAADAQTLRGVERIDASVDERLDPGDGALLEIRNADGLLRLAQLNTVELHTWNARSRSIARPDRLTFDLDPGSGVGFQQVREGALLVQSLLDELGLTAFVKTSGGRGLHLVVPIRRLHDWDTVREFSKSVVEHLARLLPARFVARSGAAHRIGRIYVDYLRNGFGATTVAAWSVRARPGLGVSVPIGWDELGGVDGGAHWTLQTLDRERLAIGNAPWKDYEARRRSLGPALRRIGPASG